MSKRPEFTIAQITERFEVSRSTLRRGLNDGRFPEARKDHAGRWVIPVENIQQAGFKARKTWFNDHAHEPGPASNNEPAKPTQEPSDTNDSAVLSELGQVKNELAQERAQVDKLKALLEAEKEHVNSLRMALRMIEAKSPVSEPEVETPKVESLQQTTGSHFNRPPGLFNRFFRRR